MNILLLLIQNPMVIFDRDFGRVWSDGTTPCVFSSVIRIPAAQEMMELLQKQAALIKELKRKFGYVYSICDLRFCQPIPNEILAAYLHHLEIQFKSGVIHKAFVKPEDPVTKKIVLENIKLMPAFSVSAHNSFEDALAKINQLRSQNNHDTLKSLFGFLANL